MTADFHEEQQKLKDNTVDILFSERKKKHLQPRIINLAEVGKGGRWG